MMMKAWMVLAAAATLCGSVEAAVIGTATLKADPPGVAFTSPDAGLGAPWVSYVLSVQTTAGELIGGLDVDIEGPLHQRWNFNEDSGLFLPTTNSQNQTNGDSHFMASAGALFFDLLHEDNSGAGSPLSDTTSADYGVGSFMNGAWGLATPATSTNVAYIVVPQDQLSAINVRVVVADPAGNIIGRIFPGCGGWGCEIQQVIEVAGNGIEIADGDVTPSLLDNTDFGDVLAGSVQHRKFTISASVFDVVNLESPVLTGPFALVGGFPTTVTGAGASFTVAFDTNVGIGSHQGSISFATDASGDGLFNFSLQGQVVPEPASGLLFGLGVLAIVSAVFSRERLG